MTSRGGRRSNSWSGTRSWRRTRCCVPDAVVEPSPDGEYLDYNRPPRLLPPARRTDVPLPDRTQATVAEPDAVADGRAARAVIGGVIALVYRNPLFLHDDSDVADHDDRKLAVRSAPGPLGHRRQVARLPGPGGGRRGRDRDGDGPRSGWTAAQPARTRPSCSSSRPDRGPGCGNAAVPIRTTCWSGSASPTYPPGSPSRKVTAPSAASATGRRRTSRSRSPSGRRASVGIAGRDDWPRRAARWLVGQLARPAEPPRRTGVHPDRPGG